MVDRIAMTCRIAAAQLFIAIFLVPAFATPMAPAAQIFVDGKSIVYGFGTQSSLITWDIAGMAVEFNQASINPAPYVTAETHTGQCVTPGLPPGCNMYGGDALARVDFQLEIVGPAGTVLLGMQSQSHSSGSGPAGGLWGSVGMFQAQQSGLGVMGLSCHGSPGGLAWLSYCGGVTSPNFDLDTTYAFQANTPIDVTLVAIVQAESDHTDVAASVDSTFFWIDPAFAGAYTLEVSRGIDNRAVRAPEPWSVAFFAVGLLAFGLRRRALAR